MKPVTIQGGPFVTAHTIDHAAPVVVFTGKNGSGKSFAAACFGYPSYCPFAASFAMSPTEADPEVRRLERINDGFLSFGVDLTWSPCDGFRPSHGTTGPFSFSELPPGTRSFLLALLFLYDEWRTHLGGDPLRCLHRVALASFTPGDEAR